MRRSHTSLAGHWTMFALPSQAGVGFQAQGGLLVVLAAVAGALLLVIACAVVWFLRGRR